MLFGVSIIIFVLAFVPIDLILCMVLLMKMIPRSKSMLSHVRAHNSPIRIPVSKAIIIPKVTCILATQSLSDLDRACGDAFKEQIIENCNTYIVMRQNSAVNAEYWGNIVGTRQTTENTYQIRQKGREVSATNLGTVKITREFIYHPEDIKTLRTGQGIFLSKDTNTHCKINVHKPF